MGSDGEPLRGRHREAEGGELGRRGEGWGGHLETSTARGGERMEGEGQGQGGQGSSSPRSRDSQLVETTGTMQPWDSPSGLRASRAVGKGTLSLVFGK